MASQTVASMEHPLNTRDRHGRSDRGADKYNDLKRLERKRRADDALERTP